MADHEVHWKFLDHRASTAFSGFQWPLPAGDEPGPWVDAHDGIRPCMSGVHACRREDLSWWLSAKLWAIELDGPVRQLDNKVVAPRGRLLGRVDGWPEVGGDLADWAVVRCRDHLAVALGALGRDDAVAAVSGADAAENLRAVGDALGPDLSTPDGVAFALASSIGNAYPDPVGCAYSCAVAAGHAATATTTDRATYARAFASERRAQAVWLAERLGL